SLTLIQLHLEELEKSKGKQKSAKKRYQKSLVENIGNANISKDVLLIKGNYGNQMCVGWVLAVYFEAYSNHCFMEPITSLDDISYISLHIFIPIHLDLF
ncbi:4252_t:CDS:2, partial [Funneliformis geosporum]